MLDERTAEMYQDGTYLERNRSWHVEDSPWKAQQILSILAANGIEPSTVAEVGCGAGEILRQLSLTLGATRFTGYEPSPQAFELCRIRKRTNLTFHCQDLPPEGAHFDCLLCIDVFEHVPDYMGFLTALRSKANYKVFHIPLDISVRSVMSGTMTGVRQLSGHLHYFTRDSALAALEDCGYDILDSRYTAVFTGLPTRRWLGTCAKPIYRAMFAVAPHATVRLLGLSSLLVLAH